MMMPMSKRSLLSLIILTLALTPMGQSLLAEGASEPLRLGIFPRRDAVLTTRLFKPLASYLEQELGRPVALEASASFEDFQQRLSESRYDLVHMNQYHFVKSHQTQGYEVLVQNEEFGEPSIRGALYVRKDSGISEVSQLKGKTILFGGGKRAMMSYVVPVYLLREAGLQEGDYSPRFASSPPNAVLATFLGQADAGGAGEVVRRLPMVHKKIDVEALTLLAVSQDLAHLPWAVRPDMPPPLRQKIRQLMLDLKQSDAGRAILKSARLSGFNPAQNSDYDEHRRIIARVEGTR